MKILGIVVFIVLIIGFLVSGGVRTVWELLDGNEDQEPHGINRLDYALILLAVGFSIYVCVRLFGG